MSTVNMLSPFIDSSSQIVGCPFRLVFLYMNWGVHGLRNFLSGGQVNASGILIVQSGSIRSSLKQVLMRAQFIWSKQAWPTNFRSWAGRSYFMATISLKRTIIWTTRPLASWRTLVLSLGSQDPLLVSLEATQKQAYFQWYLEVIIR